MSGTEAPDWVPAPESPDEFWDGFSIPYNDEDRDFEFVNALDVSEHFVKAISLSARLGQDAEDLTKVLSNLEVLIDRKKRELDRLRRRIFAEHYGEITKSASTEIQDAFVRKHAEEDGLLEQLEEIEDAIEELTQEYESLEPLLKLYKRRLRLLENKMQWAKQYLDFDKMMAKIGHQGRYA